MSGPGLLCSPFAGQARSHRIATGLRHCEWSVGGHSRGKPAPTGLSQAAGIAIDLWEAIRGTSPLPQDYHRLLALRVVCGRPFAGQACPTGLSQAAGIAIDLWEVIRGTSPLPQDYHRPLALRLICGRSFAGQARSHRIITGCRHCEWSVGGHSRDKPAPTGLSQAAGIASGLWERACPANGPQRGPIRSQIRTRP